MNVINLGLYMLTGKTIGGLPVKGCSEVSLKAAKEGIVLLKNDGVLPLSEKQLALYGCGSIDTTFCGTGSGYAFAPYHVTVYDGLVKAGFAIKSGLWIENYKKYKKEMEKKAEKLSLLDKRFSCITPYFDADLIKEEEINGIDCDTAIYCIKRNTGENFDRKAEKGDYYLSDNEKANIELLGSRFKKLIVILNTCVIDASYLQENEAVKAIVLLGQAGMESGTALADILSGKTNPSGRLTDSWARSYEDYPASKTFSANDGNTLQEDYLEDIFVGYRHFDTKGLDVVYPFGYGLSYTDFAYEKITVNADWNEITVEADIKNIGNVTGKDVLQLYVSAPKGKLRKPYQELKAYVKSDLLEAGQSQRVTLKVKTIDLASYDEEVSAWVMEKGQYLLRLGKHSRATEVIGALELDEDVKTLQLSKQLSVDRELDYYEYPQPENEHYQGNIISLEAKDYKTVDGFSTISRTLKAYVNEDKELPVSSYHFLIDTAEEKVKVRKVENATLLDVIDNKITMEEFVATLDNETLVRLLAGNGQESKYELEPRLPKNAFKTVFNGSSSGKTTAMFAKSLGIPAISLADGPAGLHLMGENSCAYPVGMVLAQTWNRELIAQVGDHYGKEMEYNKIAICLAPGMNIHRDPLCGRNFEYYSEDPFLCGCCATAFTKGVQDNHPGYGVAIKHFCCNSQELNRANSNSSVSERALREIYLKGFEMTVRNAQPLTVMSSYNLLNGVHTSSRYDLLTDVLRGEWGFEGLVMTDWDGQSDRISDLNAGNDILMGGYAPDLLLPACGSIPAEFEKDGSVKMKKIPTYGGAMHKEIDCYNSFLPDPDGDTLLEVRKEGNSDKLSDLVTKGICEIKEDKAVYKGFDRSYSLKLSVMQRNAMRILKLLAYGAGMKMAERKKG